MSGARKASLGRRIMGNSTFSSAAQKLGPMAGNLAYQGFKYARTRGYTGKIDPFIDFMARNPQLLGAFKDAGATILNSGAGLIGMGVLPSPRTAGTYTVTNNGSGVTQTRYRTVAGSLPKSVLTTGQKYLYNVITPSSCFKVANTDSVMINGVGQYVTLTAGLLQTLLTQMYTGSGTTVTDSGFLAQNGGTSSGKFYFSNCRSEVMITSATNLNCTLRIYELVSKETTGNSALRLPLSAWSLGIDDALGSNSAGDYRAIGIFPGHSESFRTYWHVDRMFDVKLAAGATHKHVSGYVINRRVPFSLFSSYSPEHVIAGLSRAYMFVLTPSPVHDQATEANVSLGGVSVDVVIKQTFEFYGVSGQRPVINLSISGDTITTAEAVTDSSNTETGVIN